MVDGTISHLLFNELFIISLFTRLEAGSLLIILIGEVRWDGDIPSIALMIGFLECQWRCARELHVDFLPLINKV